MARLGAVACLAALVAGVASSASPGTPAGAAASASTPGSTVPKTAGGVHGTPGYLVYWDQNEEVDFLSMPSATQGQLLRAWDLNGQVCVLPGGRFVGGYDPTLPNQDNLGSAKPYKQPADGEELDEPNGSFSGETLYVPGPYKMPGQSVGQDSPPTANGVFNNNSTYTGCALDTHANVFGTDIATAQGDYPPESSGRLVEWFAPNYTTYCIDYGPTSGGYGAHHTDGTGGLAQPGTMALAPNGDLLVPNVGTQSVLRFAASSLPTSAAQCPGGVYPRAKVHVSTFVGGLSFPAGVARDPSCGCYAVSSFIGNPSITWVTSDGHPEPGYGTVPGTPVADMGTNPNQYNPFGVAFAPDGTLYFVDIHVTCSGPLTQLWSRLLRRPSRPRRGDPRPTRSTGDGGQRLRLPDQRDCVRPGQDDVPVPDRQDRSTVVGALGEPGAGQGTGVGRPGHGRLRLSVPRRGTGRAPARLVAGAALAALVLAAGGVPSRGRSRRGRRHGPGAGAVGQRRSGGRAGRRVSRGTGPPTDTTRSTRSTGARR